MRPTIWALARRKGGAVANAEREAYGEATAEFVSISILIVISNVR